MSLLTICRPLTQCHSCVLSATWQMKPSRPLLRDSWQSHQQTSVAQRSLQTGGQENSTLETDRPLIVLVGWLGAHKKHVDKYAAMWQAAGHSTFHVQPRISSIMFPVLADLQSRSFRGDLTAITQPSRQVVFHVFSNAGFIFLGTCYRALALAQHIRLPTDAAPGSAGLEKAAAVPTTDSRQSGSIQPLGARHQALSGVSSSFESLAQPLSIIFDSSPALLTPSMAARGLLSAALAEPAAGVIDRRPRLVAALQSFFTAVLGLPYIRTRLEEVWGAWAVAPVCPQLFLYSAGDALMPTADIEAFMQQQAARGAAVSSRIWQDAPHCEILRCHKQEYEETARAFVTALLKSRQGPASADLTL